MLRDSELQLVRALSLFSEMSDIHFRSLMGAALLQKLPPHVILICEGESPDFLHIVVDGAVELFATDKDREATLDIVRPVTTFILAAVIRDEVYLKSARTLVPSRILMIPAAAVRDIFARDANFARAVVTELASRYRSIVRALKNRKLRTGAERLANWILQTDHRAGNVGRFALDYEKRTLASLLGMTPENLSRNLAALAQHGIATTGRELVITDRAELERFAASNLLIDE